MKDEFDVVIVSAFGRGHWLAAELSEFGKNVALVEVSHFLGRWTPEDWEGPFGYYHSERLSASQVERLTEDDYCDPVDEGFVMWLRSGPVDIKGPLSSFWFKKLGFTDQVSRYVGNYYGLAEEERETLKQDISSSAFKKTWFAHLCHQLASSTFSESAEAVKFGKPLNVMSPLNIRRVSRKGFNKSLEWCESKGVKVFKESDIIDMQIENGKLIRMEIKGSEWLGNIAGENFVWQLSSDETYHLSTKLGQQLFPGGPLKPIWGWVRYRIELDEVPSLSSLPNQFLVLNDIYLPWTHSNMLLVQRTVKSQNFDVWARIPSQMRYQRSYLENISNEIIDEFKNRIPNSDPKNIDMPQDYHYEEIELGPSRHPIYDREQLKRLRKIRIENLNFDGPEMWINMDWLGQFENQTGLKHKLLVNQNA